MKALAEMDGVVEVATEAELCDAAARADRTGLYTCPHTAVALAGLERLERRGVVRGGEQVVVVSTASGLKFTEFKVKYHERALPEVQGIWANPPVEMAADYDRVLDAIERHAAAVS